MDSRSKPMVEGLVEAARRKGFALTSAEWTVPVYLADRSTRRHDVRLRKAPPSWTEAWGTPPSYVGGVPGWRTDPNPWRPKLDGWEETRPRWIRRVPIPRGAAPDPELDGHMTVIDISTGCEYDFYAAHRKDGEWRAIWANSTRVGGRGVYPHGLSSKATGFAGAAGLIWPHELRAGRIDHALFFSYPFTRAGGPVAPATSSDGRTRGLSAIPQGARVQLDPTLDLDSLDLKPHERTIARALQRYGMILGDTGGALGLFAVHRQSFPGDAYANLLPRGSYAYLRNIPVGRFRVLELPPQRPDLSLELAPSGCAQPR